MNKQIVTLGMPSISPNERVGKYVKPRDWNALISDPDTVSIINIISVFSVACYNVFFPYHKIFRVSHTTCLLFLLLTVTPKLVRVGCVCELIYG
jgi:hypothetical protein